MSYELTLRPRSASSICMETLREKLLLAGLNVHPDVATPGTLFDNLSLFEIISDLAVPAGLSVLVKIPCGRDFFDLTLGLLNLERLAGVIDADMIDGDEMMVHSGPEGLVALFAFHSRYERASKCAATTHGVA